jgi:hypothetical protein
MVLIYTLLYIFKKTFLLYYFINAITKEAWNTAQQTEDSREKVQALSLAKECYSMKLELLTDATVVDDAIRFVSQQSRQDLKSSHNSNEDDKESNEPDCDEDKDQLEEEQEEETREIKTITNHVF